MAKLIKVYFIVLIKLLSKIKRRSKVCITLPFTCKLILLLGFQYCFPINGFSQSPSDTYPLCITYGIYRDTVIFGLADNATCGIDSMLGEYILQPANPDSFDVRFLADSLCTDGIQGTSKWDIQSYDYLCCKPKKYVLRLQPPLNYRAVFELTWSSDIQGHWAKIGIDPFPWLDMQTQNELSIPSPVPLTILIEYSGNFICEDWNYFPTLNTPPQNADNISLQPVFSWTGSLQHYRIVIAKDSLLSTPVLDSILGSSHSFQSIQLQSNTKYYWKIGGYTGCYYLWSTIENFTTSLTDNVQDPFTAPTKYGISQNYPNPFNPETNFEILIAKFGMVTVDVFDILGRKITTIVKKELSPGVHTFRWDASGFPAGLYIYRMTAGNFSQTRKLTFIK